MFAGLAELGFQHARLQHKSGTSMWHDKKKIKSTQLIFDPRHNDIRSKQLNRIKKRFPYLVTRVHEDEASRAVRTFGLPSLEARLAK